MKKLILLLSLFTLSLSAMAHVQEVAEDNDLPSISIERDNLTFKQCDNFRMDSLQSSNNILVNRIGRLQKQVTDYSAPNLSKKEKRFLKKVSKTLSCVQKKITNKLTYKCSQDNVCGSALMFVQRILFVPSSLQKNVIHACDDSFYYDYYSISGMILHEATHLCGADDIEYLLELEELNDEPQLTYNYKIKRKDDGLYYKKRLVPVNGANNADSYRYWYFNGFCMPGRDC